MSGKASVGKAWIAMDRGAVRGGSSFRADRLRVRCVCPDEGTARSHGDVVKRVSLYGDALPDGRAWATVRQARGGSGEEIDAVFCDARSAALHGGRVVQVPVALR